MSNAALNPLRKTVDKSASAAEQAASQLRQEILFIAEENIFLGSEEELSARTGVSRATFRQAIRILEHEELITIRRGVGGGYFTRSPSADSVARIASVYLAFRRTPSIHILKTANLMSCEAARTIALSDNMGVRVAPRNFLNEFSGFYEWADRRRAISVVNDYHSLMGFLSGNTALELFINVLRQFANRAEEFSFTIARLRQYSDSIHAQADAIFCGDEMKVVSLVRQELKMSLEWLEQSR